MPENEKSRVWLPPTNEEVMLMIETYLLNIIYLLFTALVAVSIIAIALVIVIAIILSK